MFPEIRLADRQDVEQIVGLMREFAEYERLLDSFETNVERLAEALFGDGKVADAVVAVETDKIVAYAVIVPYFATFRGQRGFYLEDIFITKDFRARGLGERILQFIAKLAKDRGYERIDFQVLEWNAPAIGFYEKLGAVRDDEERHFKFTDDAFQKLAE